MSLAIVYTKRLYRIHSLYACESIHNNGNVHCHIEKFLSFIIIQDIHIHFVLIIHISINLAVLLCRSIV